MTRHLVESVKFSSANDGLVLCDCGTLMSLSLFRAHRKAAGAPKGERIKAMSERVDWTRESATRWNHQRRKKA